jgi:hypothetical protein
MPTKTAPQPQIVTLAQIVSDVAARTAAAEQAYAEVTAAVAAAALEVERGGGEDALRTLATAEKKRETAAADLERRRLTVGELDRQLARQREDDEGAGKLTLVREYIASREKVQAANFAMFAAILAMKDKTEEARVHGKRAAAAAHALAFPTEESSGAPLGPQQGYMKAAMDGILGNVPRMVESARHGIMRDWGTTTNGKRALELLAALGEDAKAE